MPWAYRTMVEERRWLTQADFTETIGLCQFLPGPNIGNASIVLGKRWFGLAGSIVAFLGLMALPFIWVLGARHALQRLFLQRDAEARSSPASARRARAFSSAPRSSSAARSPRSPPRSR